MSKQSTITTREIIERLEALEKKVLELEAVVDILREAERMEE